MFHVLRLIEFQRIWNWQNIFPRWAPEFYLGYGYPIFLFTPYLPYALGVVLTWFRLSPLQAMGAEEALALLGSSWFTYMWLRRYFNLWPSMFGSALYVLAPYHLVNLYFRGDLAELLGQMWIPAVLWSIGWISDKPAILRSCVVALIGACLLSTHLLSALLVTPVLILNVFRLLLVKSRRYVIISSAIFGVSGLLALSLSSASWLPGVTSTADATLSKLLHFYNYQENFVQLNSLFSRSLIQHYAPVFAFGHTSGYQIGMIQSIALLAGFFALFWRLFHKDWLLSLDITLYLLVAIGAIALCTSATRPIWQHLPPLQLAQFPWRWLTTVSIAGAFSGAAAMDTLKRNFQGIAAVTGTAIMALSSLLLLTPVRFVVPANLATSQGIAQFEITYHLTGTTAAGEYLPRTVQHRASVSAWAVAQATGWTPPRDGLATVAPSEHLLLSPTYTIDHPSASTIILPMVAAPGWRVKVDGKVQPFHPAPESGLIQLQVPGGLHHVSLRYEGTPLTRAADMLTIISFLGVGLVFFGNFFRIVRAAASKASQGSILGGIRSYILGELALIVLASVTLGAMLQNLSISASSGALNASVGPLLFRSFTVGYSSSSQEHTPLQAEGGQILHMKVMVSAAKSSRVLIQFLDPGGTVWRSWTAPVASGVHTVHIDATLPVDMYPGIFLFRLGAIAGGTEMLRLSQASAVDLLPVDGTLLVGPLIVLPEHPRVGMRPVYHWVNGPGVGDTSVPSKILAGSSMTVRWVWNVGAAVPAAPITTVLHLVDHAGRTVAAQDSAPDNGYFPSAFWSAGDRIADTATFSIPPDLLPGRYSLTLGLSTLTGPLPAVNAQGAPMGDDVLLGTVLVLPPSQPAPVTIPLTQIGPLSIGLAAPVNPAQQGMTLDVPVELHSPAPHPPVKSLIVSLLRGNRVFATRKFPVGSAAFPPEQWRAGETEQQWLAIQIPASISPGEALLTVTVVGSGGKEITTPLTMIHIVGRPL
ncbi:MAG: 6-pyruvoyl-tetrahydropterin synthase-related protein, partial [Chloroflexi bacterium]|nr:6-pyruvoyl-tetrahydropterin synthase-related protein [Chloroflexota bacterium]